MTLVNATSRLRASAHGTVKKKLDILKLSYQWCVLFICTLNLEHGTVGLLIECSRTVFFDESGNGRLLSKER